MPNFSLSRQGTALIAAFVLVSIASVMGLSYAFEGNSSDLRKLFSQGNDVNKTLFTLIEAVVKVQGVSQKLIRVQ